MSLHPGARLVEVVGKELQVPPKLETKRSINGLCFFNGCPAKGAAFPWPAELAK